MLDTYSFTRCVRPNGTAYGTSGQCRSGVEQEKQAIQQLLNMLPAGERVVSSEGKLHSKPVKFGKISEETLHNLKQKAVELELASSRQKGILKGMSKDKKFQKLRDQRQEKIDKLETAWKKLREKVKEIDTKLNNESQRSGIPRPLMPSNWTPS